MWSVEWWVAGSSGELLVSGERPVPVVGGWSQTLDRGMQGDHPVSSGIAGVVGVEAAEDFVAAGDEAAEPERIGAHTGGRDAEAFGTAVVGALKQVAVNPADQKSKK